MDPRQNESRGEEASRTLDSFPFKGEVYPPSEDTFLMAEVLEELDVKGVVLEIGVGSGYLTKIISRKAEYVVGTDISYCAIKTSKNELEKNKIVNVDLVLTDSALVFRSRSFSLIISNPPYLPCSYKEEPLWCGGQEGIEFTLRLARQSANVMAPNGKLVFVASSLANVKKLTRLIRKFYTKVHVLKVQEVSLFEKLFILECIV